MVFCVWCLALSVSCVGVWYASDVKRKEADGGDTLRRAVFAGSWYPGPAAACEAEIDRFRSADRRRRPASRTRSAESYRTPAGSTPAAIACSVIQALAAGPPPDVMVVFGTHLHPASPSVIMPTGSWETPFGPLPVAEELAAELRSRFPFRLETPERFTQDNTIELQLPFIKYFFPEAAFWPWGFRPPRTRCEVADVVVDLPAAGSRGEGDRVDRPHALRRQLRVRRSRHRGRGRHLGAARERSPGHRCDAGARPATGDGGGPEKPERLLPGGGRNRHPGRQALGATTAETISYATSYDRSPGDSFVGYVGIVFRVMKNGVSGRDPALCGFVWMLTYGSDMLRFPKRRTPWLTARYLVSHTICDGG